MALFAYTVHIDGVTSAHEIDAGDELHARRLAQARHRKDGVSVSVHMVFRPPPRIGSQRYVPTMPTEEMRQRALRINLSRDLWGKRPRLDHARDRQVRR